MQGTGDFSMSILPHVIFYDELNLYFETEQIILFLNDSIGEQG